MGVASYYREYLLVDPSFEEEQVLNGQMLIVMNIHSEICTMQMTGGVALSSEQVAMRIHDVT